MLIPWILSSMPIQILLISFCGGGDFCSHFYRATQHHPNSNTLSMKSYYGCLLDATRDCKILWECIIPTVLVRPFVIDIREYFYCL